MRIPSDIIHKKNVFFVDWKEDYSNPPSLIWWNPSAVALRTPHPDLFSYENAQSQIRECHTKWGTFQLLKGRNFPSVTDFNTQILVVLAIPTRLGVRFDMRVIDIVTLRKLCTNHIFERVGLYWNGNWKVYCPYRDDKVVTNKEIKETVTDIGDLRRFTLQ